jgi:hypothetical protein
VGPSRRGGRKYELTVAILSVCLEASEAMDRRGESFEMGVGGTVTEAASPFVPFTPFTFACEGSIRVSIDPSDILGSWEISSGYDL